MPGTHRREPDVDGIGFRGRRARFQDADAPVPDRSRAPLEGSTASGVRLVPRAPATARASTSLLVLIVLQSGRVARPGTGYEYYADVEEYAEVALNRTNTGSENQHE